MKHLTKGILVGSAFLCATSLSFGSPDSGGLPLLLFASAQARVSHPATPASVAGVTRRHVRHAAYVGAGSTGAAAVGTTAAISSAYAAYGHSGCLPGPHVGAFATEPWDNTPTCPNY